uniref:Uncharacterized protein n=1 Tax=Pipistrellus kuhlii TaxID=59472 RepID=A0A7J7RD59_PIPKU|nr:hypothetical protein mPipKuh1_010683 [Pipistrellus kuhlii]
MTVSVQGGAGKGRCRGRRIPPSSLPSSVGLRGRTRGFQADPASVSQAHPYVVAASSQNRPCLPDRLPPHSPTVRAPFFPGCLWLRALWPLGVGFPCLQIPPGLPGLPLFPRPQCAWPGLGWSPARWCPGAGCWAGPAAGGRRGAPAPRCWSTGKVATPGQLCRLCEGRGALSPAGAGLSGENSRGLGFGTASPGDLPGAKAEPCAGRAERAGGSWRPGFTSWLGTALERPGVPGPPGGRETSLEATQ